MPTTVSRVAKTLDAAVEAFHRRPFGYKALMGVVLSRKTGAGALKRPVLVVLGLRPDGRDRRLPPGEGRERRRMGAHDLYARGLTGEGLETICVDGGQGLLAAPACHGIPVQRCRAHKICPRQGAQGRSGRRQAGSPRCRRHNRTRARSAANRFATRREDAYPKAVACLRDDLDDLLTCFRYKDPDQRRQVRTTNAIERRRPRPMGAFQDRTLMDHILFSIFIHENKQPGISTL